MIDWMTKVSQQATPVQTTHDPLMLAYCEQILNGLECELYFPEDLHTADTGRDLFNLALREI